MNSKKKPVTKPKNTKPKKSNAKIASAQPSLPFDTAGHKQVQEALEVSEAKFKFMFEQSIVGKSFTLPSGEISVNRALCDMLGYSQEELQNRKWQEITHPDDIEATQKEVEALLSGEKEAARFTKRYLHKNGAIVWADISTSVHRDKDGKALYFMTEVNDITERKQEGEALADSEERFRKIFEEGSIGMVLTSRDMKFFSANPAFCQMLGYKVEEMSTKTFLDVTHPEHRAADRENVEKMWKGEIPYYRTEKRYITKNGEICWGSLSASLILGQSGEPLYALAMIVDITERKRAEEQLRYQATLLANVNDAIVASDRQFKLTALNAAAESLYGWKAEEVLGRNGPEIFRTEWPSLDADEMRRKIAEIGHWRGEATQVLKDGTRIPVEISSIVLRDKSGQITGYVSMNRDITERKQTQILQEAVYRIATAAETTQSLDELFNQIHQIISSVMPAENFYITLYDEAQNLLRFPYFKDAEDETFMGGIQPGKGLTAYVLRTGKSLLCTQEVHNELERMGEVKLLGVPSAIWLGIPLIVEGKTIGAMVVQHYSDPWAYGEREQHMLEFVSTQVAIAINRKRAEEEIRQLNAELEQRVEERTRELREAQEKMVRQEKLAVLGQLAGGVGHELRNPLAVINTSIYYLKLVQPEASEKIKEHHAMIEQEVHTAEKIITDLLDFARVSSMERELVSVKELVQRVLVRFPAPPTVEVTLKLPAGLPLVFTDPHQMEQVLVNLIVNAYQAMLSPGSTTAVKESCTLAISARRKKGMVAIAVKDSGVGIPAENMSKLFEPLFTTKARGIGLGLAVSKKLAEANGGRIEVASEPGKGSTFTLVLPVYKE